MVDHGAQLQEHEALRQVRALVNELARSERLRLEAKQRVLELNAQLQPLLPPASEEMDDVVSSNPCSQDGVGAYAERVAEERRQALTRSREEWQRKVNALSTKVTVKDCELGMIRRELKMAKARIADFIAGAKGAVHR